MPHLATRPRARRVMVTTAVAGGLVGVALVLALVLALVPANAGPAAATPLPPVIAADDSAGDDVTIRPAVVRAPDGDADLDVVLGTDARGDLVVEPRLARAAVTDDGTVQLGAGRATGTVSAGARLRPGERLRVNVTGLTEPTLVVVVVRAADAGDGATTEGGTGASGSGAEGGDPGRQLASLVLPGPVGTSPTVSLTTADGQATAAVRASAPLLVTVEVVGRDRTTFPERLVLPDQAVQLPVPTAPWPRRTTVAVTDEAGRTVTAATSPAPLVLLAVGSLAATAIATVALAGRRRRRRDAPAPGAAGADPTATA